MSNNQRFNIYGHNGSPYSCKIRAYFRYKRIPFNWHQGIKWSLPKFQTIKPRLIPVVEFPDGATMNESTAIIQKIESDPKYQDRAVFISSTPSSLQFLCNFLEDFGDEWLNKSMFGIRWNRKLDQDFTSLFFILNNEESRMSKNAQFMANIFKKRMIPRTDLVGCANDEFMHNSLHLILDILQNNLKKGNMFLFGSRPCNADFAFYGQIKEFGIDPTADKILREEYPYIFAWSAIMDDLSGFDVGSDQEWITLDDIINNKKQNNCIMELLRICSDIYLPFLKSNSIAFNKKKKRFSVQLLIDNKYRNKKKIIKHEQPTWRWQDRCYRILKKQLNQTLNSCQDKVKLVQILKQTNCYDILMDGILKSKL